MESKMKSFDIEKEESFYLEQKVIEVLKTIYDPLPPMIEHALLVNIKEARSAMVSVVWEPAWTTDLMTEDAKLELGMF